MCWPRKNSLRPVRGTTCTRLIGSRENCRFYFLNYKISKGSPLSPPRPLSVCFLFRTSGSHSESHSQAGSTTRNWAILCVTGFLLQFHTTRFSILGQNTPAVVSFELNLTFFHLYWTRRTIMFSWSLKKMVFLLLLLLQLVSLSGAAPTSDSIEQVPTCFFKCDHFLSLMYPI